MLNLTNLGIPATRLPSSQWALTPSTSARYGEERLMTNVLSFEVKFTGTPVSLTYDVPFKFTGKIHKVTIDMK